jgi:UDP-galactopyranose mutase
VKFYFQVLIKEGRLMRKHSHQHGDIWENKLMEDSNGKSAYQDVDLVCLSHLRWNFVYQRPQHLLSRCARESRVFIIEEPVYGPAYQVPVLKVDNPDPNLWIVIPHLMEGMDEVTAIFTQKRLLDDFFQQTGIERYVLWYYTPMAVPFTRHLKPMAIIYDCMDQLSAFKGAPPELIEREQELFNMANLVFTGGHSLYEEKRQHHPHVHAFPSSVEVSHFAQARTIQIEPADQVGIPHPRLGFFGVVDERMDIHLLDELAKRRPDWQFVIIGPIVKIDPASLPQHPNIHYLGGKDYKALPHYLAGWDIAIMPFARNESTQFISPTKTPEYLAAGKRVISTSIRDVVRPYGELGIVRIADAPEQFIQVAEETLQDIAEDSPEWGIQVDALLEQTSWDKTWAGMRTLIQEAITSSHPSSPKKNASPAVRRLPPSEFDFLIVGAGFAGSVIAERLANQGNQRVLIVDKRSHIGGNAYDHYNEDGLLIHKYGPHIFHTNSREIYDYLSEFTQWRHYEHEVKAHVDNQLVPIPINQNTINKLYGLSLDEAGIEDFLAARRENRKPVRTSEDVVLNAVGRELYEKFFQGYTRKQWGMDPSELDSTVTARIPTRNNTDDRYFTDTYQVMPKHGFTRMFENMLNHPNIKVMLNTDYREIETMVPFKKTVYTGPVDEYFNFCYGKLPYRSLDFKHETHDAERHQPAPVINYPNHHDYTRVTEFKYLTGQVHPKTSLVYEFPQSEGDPYYPVPKPENAEVYAQYKALADTLDDVYFVGRLATYKYYNMDQVVGQALTTYKQIMGEKPVRKIGALVQA